MRTRCPLLLATLVTAGLLGCSGAPAPSSPTEYIRLRYRLSGGSGGVDQDAILPLPAGSVACGRQAKELRLSAEKGGVSVEIALRDAATMPATLLASSVTAGKVNVDVVVPGGADLGGPVSFASSDPGDLFVCHLTLLGPDPFAELRLSFDCDSKVTDGRKLTISDGEVRAAPCR